MAICKEKHGISAIFISFALPFEPFSAVRLELEPRLVTHFPLTEGWLLRVAFGALPRYLRRSSAVPRADVEPLLADSELLKQFLQEKLGETTRELTFGQLRALERSYIHQAAQAMGLTTASHGTGAARQLVVRRELEEEEE